MNGGDVHFVLKGVEEQVDSYSAVYNVAGSSDTQLPEMLKKWKIDKVYVVGLALDYCVKSTALDIATKLGIETVVLTDLTRAVAPDTGKAALKLMGNSGVTFSEYEEIIGFHQSVGHWVLQIVIVLFFVGLVVYCVVRYRKKKD